MSGDQFETPLDRLRIQKEIYAPFHAQVKILEILPADLAEPEILKCTLRKRAPWDRRPYTALSYVWDDSQVTTAIIVNERQTSVTINLVEVLCHLRNCPEYAKSLWIDALCIDQQNEQEKSQQVQMMDVIYQEADTVVAWLGAADDTSKQAMETIKDLSKTAIELGIQNLNQPSMHEIDLQRGRELIAKAGMAVLGSPALHDGDLGRVVDFLQKPYWNRPRIIQEVNLARRAILICGSDKISWVNAQAAFAIMVWISNFYTSIDAYAAARLVELSAPYGGSGWRLPRAVRMSGTNFATENPKLSFIDLFVRTCDGTHLEVSQPSDRIYALLGFMTPSMREVLTVDYERAFVVLFTAITRYCLGCGGANTLMLSGLAYRNASQIDLPSWTWDWTTTKPRSENRLHFQQNRTLPSSSPCRLVPIGTRKIAIRGAKVGQVVKVVEYSEASEDALGVVNELQRIAHPPSIDASSLRILIVSILNGIAEQHRPIARNILCYRARPCRKRTTHNAEWRRSSRVRGLRSPLSSATSIE